MPTRPITPRPAEGLRLLAASQLQIQAARSVALDGGALGIVSACVAVAAIVLGVRSAHHLEQNRDHPHFESLTVPDLMSVPIFVAWMHDLWRRLLKVPHGHTEDARAGAHVCVQPHMPRARRSYDPFRAAKAS